MIYTDKHGNDHEMGKSKSIAAATEDGHLKWLIDEDGKISMTIGDKELLSMDVYFFAEPGEPTPFPFENVRPEDIIYRKTHAATDWLMDGESVGELGDRDIGWEIGMKMRGAVKGNEFGLQTRVFITYGHTDVEVISITPTLVRVTTSEGEEEFKSKTGSMLKFSMKVS
jgi:hypothetical protein